MLALALIVAGMACLAAHIWCEGKCTELDVASGRRDSGALVDDYGSNRGWYPQWKIPSLLAVGAGIAMLLWALSIATARAHDHNRPGLNRWYQGLQSSKGPCCDGSDATHLADIDWESRAGHYRVRIEDRWWDVPDDAVITEPNRAGRTMVWPIYYRGLGALLRIEIRCFMPGSMT